MGKGRTASRRAVIGIAGAAAVVAAGGVVAGVETGVIRRPGSVRITVNGAAHDVTASPDTPLLYVLRNEVGSRGLHFGCGLSECGACTVQLDGRAVRSCVTKVGDADGKRVTTLEGLGSPAHPHPLQAAFIQHQAAQCGYCIAGMIVEAEAFLRETPRPSRAQIKSALAGHLCRCGTHYRVLDAVEAAAKGGPA